MISYLLESLKNTISKNFNTHKSKLILLPNPIDESLFTLRKIPNFNPQFIIVCISLFRPEKRIDLLLESFNNLVNSGIKAKLKLIGDGPLKHEIENQIQNFHLRHHHQIQSPRGAKQGGFLRRIGLIPLISAHNKIKS